MNIGKTIRLLRIAAGLEQKELAQKLELSPSLVSLIENNLREPSVTQLRKISKVFNVPVSLLVFDQSVDCNRLSDSIKTDVEHMYDLMLKVFGKYLEPHGESNQ